MNSRYRAWSDVPPFTCVLCGAPLHRIPHRGGLDEWQWADAQGSPAGTDPDLLHLYDPQLNPVGATSPYDALNKLAALMDQAHTAKKACLTWVYWQAAREYSGLKARLDMGGTFHQHVVSPATPSSHEGPVPEHCGWPMRLAPSGWRCRQCGERTEAPITETPATAVSTPSRASSPKRASHRPGTDPGTAMPPASTPAARTHSPPGNPAGTAKSAGQERAPGKAPAVTGRKEGQLTDCLNPAHAGDPRDGCTACARACQRELTKISDIYHRLLSEQNAWQKAVTAAATRRAHDHARAFAHLVLPSILSEPELAGHLQTALGRATMIDPEWGRTREAREKLARLRTSAQAAQRTYWRLTGRDGLAGQYREDPARAEIERLRTVIQAHGHRLHALATRGLPDYRDPCGCQGCDLIRSMDDVPLDLEPAAQGSP